MERLGNPHMHFNMNEAMIEELKWRWVIFAVKFHVRSRGDDGFSWALVAIYGVAQSEFKPNFLAELVRVCQSESLLMLMGGDFSILRRHNEKNKDNFDGRWPWSTTLLRT